MTALLLAGALATGLVLGWTARLFQVWARARRRECMPLHQRMKMPVESGEKIIAGQMVGTNENGKAVGL